MWYPATKPCSASGRSNGARGLGGAGEEEDDETDDLRDRVPERVGLRRDDLRERERPGHDHDPEHGERERDLVRHELRARPHRAEQCVLRVRRPAADDEPVHAERADREDEDERDVDVGDLARDVHAADLPAGPNGITENVVSAVNAARNGPSRYSQSIAAAR